MEEESRVFANIAHNPAYLIGQSRAGGIGGFLDYDAQRFPTFSDCNSLLHPTITLDMIKLIFICQDVRQKENVTSTYLIKYITL